MSLHITDALLERAETGEVTDEEFATCVRDSLPYAWAVISDIAVELRRSSADVVEHAVPPPSETARGQLLRALASDAIRNALQRRFGIVLAFQNCHRVAAFVPAAVGGERHHAFISTRDQILNQSPLLRDC